MVCVHGNEGSCHKCKCRCSSMICFNSVWTTMELNGTWMLWMPLLFLQDMPYSASDWFASVVFIWQKHWKLFQFSDLRSQEKWFSTDGHPVPVKENKKSDRDFCCLGLPQDNKKRGDQWDLFKLHVKRLSGIIGLCLCFSCGWFVKQAASGAAATVDCCVAVSLGY